MSEAEELLRGARSAITALRMYEDVEEFNAQFDTLCAKIDAYLARPADGVVVPREPSEELSQRFYRLLEIHGTKNFYPVWQGLLSAAPSDRKGGGE